MKTLINLISQLGQTRTLVAIIVATGVIASVLYFTN